MRIIHSPRSIAQILLLLLLVPVQAWATTFYVSTSGSDANSCATAQSATLSNAKRTIMGGLSCLSPGDTLDIRAGTYTTNKDSIDSQNFPTLMGMSLPVGTNTTTGAITVTAHSGEVVELRPPYGINAVRLYTGSPTYYIIRNLILNGINTTYPYDTDVILLDSGYNTFDGVEVKNAPIFGVHAGANGHHTTFINGSVHDIGTVGGGNGNGHGFYFHSSNNLFENNDIYNNRGFGFHLYSNSDADPTHANPSNNVVIRNRIHGNGAESSGFGVVIAWGSDNLIASNLIYNNVGGGVQSYTASINTVVANNTLYANGPYGLEGQFNGSGTVFRNNISWGHGTADVIVFAPATITQDNNICTTTSGGVGSCESSSDPGFLDAAGGDFHTSNSNALNTGTTVAAVTVDFSNTARPQGAAYDIGAYEYASGSGVTITTTSLADGQRTAAYSQSAFISGGSGTLSSCTTSAGTIPAGLSWSISGYTCVLSGTPTVATSYSFTLTATDNAAATDTQAYSLTIADIDAGCSSSTSGSWTLLACPGASSSNGTANAVTTAVDTSSGDFAACAVVFDKNVTAPTFADSKGNGWTQLISQSGTYGMVRLFVSRLVSVGSGHTFTVTTGGTMSFPAVQCAIFSGSHPTPIDLTAPSAATVASMTLQPGLLTTTRTKELVLVAMQAEDANTVSATDGFTLYQRAYQLDKAFGVVLGWQTVDLAAQTVNPTLSWATSMDASATGGSFLASNSANPLGNSGTLTRARIRKR